MTSRPSDSVRLLEEYSQAHGASGHEDAVRAIFLRELRGRRFTADGLGGVLAAPAAEVAGPRVVLTAHMDEVGFLIHDITPDGFHITAKGRRYLAPLIKGEDYPPYKDGLPQYVVLRNKPVRRKLKTRFVV